LAIISPLLLIIDIHCRHAAFSPGLRFFRRALLASKEISFAEAFHVRPFSPGRHFDFRRCHCASAEPATFFRASLSFSLAFSLSTPPFFHFRFHFLSGIFLPAFAVSFSRLSSILLSAAMPLSI
jgi:hypothetical protein